MMKAYSYHTFILPFIWEKSAHGREKLERQYSVWQDKYRKDENWEEMYIFKDGKVCLSEDISMDQFYKEYKYFHPHICESIYGNTEFGNNSGKSIVTCFTMRPGGHSLKGSYKIRRDDKIYSLDLDAVEVRLYNTGIGLYTLKCANRKKSQFQFNLEAVKDINDYGRRITLPVLNNPVCAHELSLDIDGIGRFYEDWSEISKKAENKDFDSLGYVSKTVTGPMGIKYGEISLGIDDRMIVESWTSDEIKVKEFIDIKKRGGNYPFIEDEDISKDLYEIAAVDHAGDCTCQSFDMRKALLDKYVYQRWLDYQSVYTVSAQGINAVSSADDEEKFPFLVENFLTQYYQLICLCLAQRTSIINFSRKAEQISRGIERNTATLTRKDRERMMDLQERYIAFITQIDTTEASPEEQGIEMYNMIRSVLNTEREKDTLKSQLAGLYELAESAQSYNFNLWAWTVAFLALIISVGQLAANIGSPVLVSMITLKVVFFSVFVLLIWVTWKKWIRKKFIDCFILRRKR